MWLESLNIYYLTLYRKSLTIPGLDYHVKGLLLGKKQAGDVMWGGWGSSAGAANFPPPPLAELLHLSLLAMTSLPQQTSAVTGGAELRLATRLASAESPQSQNASWTPTGRL